jgi:tetratricopeptide (TPR) repeat protein
VLHSIAVSQESPGAILNRAYELITTDPGQAARLFEQASVLDPSNVAIKKQLGYLYLSQQKNEEALEQFSASEKIQPSDTIKLQRAYILSSLRKPEEAKTLFSELTSSPYPDIREKAEGELHAFSENANVSNWWTHIYAAPYYDTRWKALFYQGHIQHGYYLSEDRVWSLYGIASISGDNKSDGLGLAPVIISDNSLLLGVGVRVKPFTGFMLDLQEGVAIGLIDRGSGTVTKGDFRAVATYGNGIYAPFAIHDDFRMPMYPFADVYASAGYYSRYKNVIGYAQVRAGLRAVEVSKTAVDAYVRMDIARDTEKLFYNNIVEFGPGIRLTPNIDGGLYLVGEYHRGVYWDVSDAAKAERASLYDANYNSFRFFLIFERTF